MTATDVLGSFGEDQDVGKCRCAGRDTKENEIRGDSKGASSGNDPDMLREVGDKNPDYNQTGGVMLDARYGVVGLLGFFFKGGVGGRTPRGQAGRCPARPARDSVEMAAP